MPGDGEWPLSARAEGGFLKFAAPTDKAIGVLTRETEARSQSSRSYRSFLVPNPLRRWNLNIGNNVRVAAFCVTGIHGSGCVTVIRSVGNCGIGKGRSGIQRGTVDLRVGAAGG
jgi:hypothetical protein